ncbi:AraC-like DNA-binding protein [Cohnella sp. SGD-V74]|uniref:AraC family transcriptional regulator n=1 Tax=unclassified Cohnella TaxID=2636738 RepID=UPI000D48FC9C|nr:MULTISPECIES: helix-turn-helix domain-containing protein [unclassified Cohnella]PRX72303.1 AraC-like DNA-binding protein [Cohnella sp. SGD-V74]
MNHLQLDELLRGLDAVERIQLRTRENVNDFDGGELADEPDGIPRMQGKYFFGSDSVSLRKHHRFAAMPVHKHDFIELNYMYSGSCEQRIDGRQVTLRQGDACLMDRNVPHGIAPLGENDILVNLLLRKETLASAFPDRAPEGGAVASFIAHALSERQRHGRYIVFRPGERVKLHGLMCDMMCEFFDPDGHSADLLRHYVPILLIELMRIYDLDLNYEPEPPLPQGVIRDVLLYMEENPGSCTLTELAERFHFSPKYLGSLLKSRTGLTYTEWVQRQRLNRAARLLMETDASVDEVARQCGYESLGFFYRKFKARFGRTPHDFRSAPRTLPYNP